MGHSGQIYTVNPKTVITSCGLNYHIPDTVWRASPTVSSFRRICSREEDFVRHCENLRTHFIRRGYPTRLLDSAIDRAGDNRRKDLLTPHDGTVTALDEERRLFANTTFHPTQRDFSCLLEENWDMLGSPATQGLYESEVVFGQRRPKNLRDMLVQAKVKLPRRPL